MNMTDAWIMPLLPAAAFVVLLLTGAVPATQGRLVAIGCMAAAFVARVLDRRGLHRRAGRAWRGVRGRFEQYRVDHDPRRTSTSTWASMSTHHDSHAGGRHFVALMVQMYSLGYMHGDSRYGWFYAVLSFFAASMLALVLADNFLLLYFTWELVGLCSFLLIGHYMPPSIGRRSGEEGVHHDAHRRRWAAHRDHPALRETGTFNIRRSSTRPRRARSGRGT